MHRIFYCVQLHIFFCNAILLSLSWKMFYKVQFSTYTFKSFEEFFPLCKNRLHWSFWPCNFSIVLKNSLSNALNVKYTIKTFESHPCCPCHGLFLDGRGRLESVPALKVWSNFLAFFPIWFRWKWVCSDLVKLYVLNNVSTVWF